VLAKKAQEKRKGKKEIYIFSSNPKYISPMIYRNWELLKYKKKYK